MRLLCGSINVRERPWASKRQPIDYKRCCTDRLNAQPKAAVMLDVAFHSPAHHGTFDKFFSGPLMRFGVFAALLLIFAVAHTTSASAERRVALVIGNSAYQNVPKLPNPVNDARAVAALLRNAGFDVVESRSDLGIANIRRAMRDFTNIARDADIGVVYYAGHGIEVDGTNYLIPVDAVLERDVDVDDEA